MTIKEAVERGKGTAGAWRVEVHGVRRELWHYSTRMLVWTRDGKTGRALVLDTCTGWGSVSDQNGMNTAFKALGLPLRFDRDQRGGGPRITELTLHPCGHVTDPAVDHRSCPVLLDMLMTGVAR